MRVETGAAARRRAEACSRTPSARQRRRRARIGPHRSAQGMVPSWTHALQPAESKYLSDEDVAAAAGEDVDATGTPRDAGRRRVEGAAEVLPTGDPRAVREPAVHERAVGVGAEDVEPPLAPRGHDGTVRDRTVNSGPIGPAVRVFLEIDLSNVVVLVAGEDVDSTRRPARRARRRGEVTSESSQPDQPEPGR